MKPITAILKLLIMFGFLMATANPNVIAKPYPLEYFALRDVVNNVVVSPDGKKLALIKIPSKKGNPTVEIYDASDLSKKPYRFNADPMEIQWFNWISDTNILMGARQKVRDRIDGFNQGVFENRIVMFDLEKKKFKNFKEVNPSVESLLPDKPNKIIISFNPQSTERSAVDGRFRPRSYYEFDLKKGTKKLLYRGKLSLGALIFDRKGNAVFARGFDSIKRDLIWYVREPGGDDWKEVFRLSENSFEDFAIQGFDTLKPNTLLVTAQNGGDKRGLWEFDYVKKKFGEAIYLRSDVDVIGVRRHSNGWTNPNEITAVAYQTDKTHFEYFDKKEEAIFAQLEKLIPNAHNVRITSRAREGQTIVIQNVGPRDPGSYYLLKDGHLKTIGSRQPLLKSENLADVKYITYKSRDGKDIRAYITIPKGDGPFPTILMPHGGPFVQEVVGYDEWGQLLANNGYLVLQPQYRGSLGYGIDFYKSAFINGGEGGHKMQDDKDDGITYLIKKGLADPKRVALYGWSYGGYSALVAASRTPQIHQCVIAGAAVSDTLYQVNFYRDFLTGVQLIEQETMWVDSISPIKEVAKVNVPMLVIHGSVDQRVPPEHAKRYIEGLKKHNKDFKYVELEGADHFSNTLYYGHQLKLYESLLDYLKNDCGPDGL